MGAMVAGGSDIINTLFVFLMIAALILIIVTAMAGSSRTLYQGSVDGWLPRYLSRVNHNGAPTAAMWTDLVFNLVLLSIASTDATAYYFILAVSNCGYIIFNFLNLNAGWIHRIDSGHIAASVQGADHHPGAGWHLRLRERDVHGRRRQGVEPRMRCCGASSPPRSSSRCSRSGTISRTRASSRRRCWRISA